MDSTRDRIVRAAAELVDHGGPAAVTLREVGTRAGVSRAAPYKHFTGKRDLLAAVAATELDRLAGTIRAAAAGTRSRVEAFETATLTYVRWAQEHPERFELVFGRWDDEAHPELDAAAERATTALLGLAHDAVAAGELHGSPDRIAVLVWSLGHGAAALDVAGHLHKKPGGPSAADLVRDLLGLLREHP
ncbi:TetR/AcrR family transcriptional regulator [Myceligenerans crystallogenes]|uniref:TetR/AcrR family transcriptional regulator n=1 Tax=Myceligenerans crystallogenes TaxID=316335 RepID=A0ABP4ZV92_9MICO